MKIGSKLILIITALVVICIAISGTIYYFTAEKTIEERVKAQLESVAVLKENQFNDFIGGSIEDVEGLAKEKFFVESFIRELKAHAAQEANEMIYHENVKQLLKEKLAYKKNFFEFFILSLDGRIHLSTDKVQEGKFKLDEPYFIEGRNGTYLQNFYYDVALLQPAITIATPIKDNQEKVVGVLAGRVDLNGISNIMTERSGLGETGETYLVNKFNLLVSKSRFTEGIEFKKVIHTEEVKDCLKGNNGYGHYNNYRNVSTLGVYRWLPERELCLLVEIDKAEAFMPINRLKFIILLIGIGSIFLTIIIGLFLTQTITKPIISLRDAAVRIGEGRLDTQIEIKKKDEIGDLAAAFNQMTGNLRKTTTSIDNLNQEIAERKKAEEQLRKAEEKYRMQFEGALDAIFVADAETGIITDCNPAATRLVGREKSELVGKHQRILHPPGKIEGEFSKTFKEHLKEKQGQTLETQVITKTGEIRDIAIKANLLEIRGKKLLQGIFRDITENKKAEEALKESEQRLNNILNSILTGVVIVDAETHQIVDANPLATELIGLPREEIIGRVCHKFICPAEEGKCPISDLSQTVDQSERVLIRGDGKEIPILKTATPVSWQGRSYLVESFIDITERKQAEQRQAKLLEQVEKINQELKDFAYIVSHDLKAPLRGIKTLAEWITTDYADKLDDNGKEQMKLLTGRVDRMHNLIDGILQYSRVGRVEEEKVVVNLNELVPEIIDMIAPPENITITVENELPTIECEQTRIMQVFQNLLSNAVKYMDKPKGQIKVGCVEVDDSWEFYVADNGPGIEEKYFEKIFQLFQTLSPRDESESTGIGLTVTKKIVELYKGKIWVESKVGEGSTFFFTLPKQKIGIKDAKLQASTVS
jgi:two-component system sensor kinase FixL